MKVSSILEVLSAAHLSNYVDTPFVSRGGIMLVAPPGNLKSTVIVSALDAHKPRAKVLSDVNAQQLGKLRGDIADNKILTLGFPELEKLYMRRLDTAMNVEGHIKGMVEEGFRHMLHEHPDAPIKTARCVVIGGITQAAYEERWEKWHGNGFERRFIWARFALHNPDVLMSAIHRWERAKLIENHVVMGPLAGEPIPYCVTEEESGWIWSLFLHFDHAEVPFILMKKILSVLRWRYPKGQYNDRALLIMQDFAEALSVNGANLTLETPPEQLVLPGHQPGPMPLTPAMEKRILKERAAKAKARKRG